MQKDKIRVSEKGFEEPGSPGYTGETSHSTEGTLPSSQHLLHLEDPGPKAPLLLSSHL